MNPRLLVSRCLLSGVLLLAGAAWAETLTIGNFGGANGRAQAVAFQKPFSAQFGTPVVAVEYDGGLAQVRRMVQQGRVEWDVVEVESDDLVAGCAAGLFERVDRSELQYSSMLVPGTIRDCGVGAFIWSTVLAYDADKIAAGPRTWADFWDVERFHGKRGLRKGPRYNLEMALMADGVARADVYRVLATPQGLDRALRKLQALKPWIVWWESGAQPAKMLADGQVAMTTAYNGRIAAANGASAESHLAIVWPDSIYEFDYWAIPKGSPHRQLAMNYVNLATSAEAQLAFSREIPYGPTNFKAILDYDAKRHGRVSNQTQAVIDLSMVESDLPSAPGNLRKALPFDAEFWVKYGRAIEERFDAAMR